MRLSILAENFTRSPYILPEYGLSLHLELGGSSVLVDTAQGRTLFPNAATMGIDLRKLDLLALSHGHFDHVGGVPSLFSYHGPMPLWAHPRVDALHARLREGKPHFIGFHLNWAATDFRPVTNHVELCPGFWGFEVPQTRRDPEFMKNPAHLIEGDAHGWIPDPFDDDLSFVAEGEQGLCLVLGCAHAGVVNILEEAARIFGTRTFATVVGGMHLADQGDEYLGKVAGILAEKFDVGRWLPCHCTGFQAAARLALRGQNVDWGYVGTSIEI